MSIYILLVQAMKNEVDVGLAKNDNEFARVLGSTAVREVMDTINCRFNMDGTKPTGQKVGLLDRHHLWAYLVDPFNHSLRSMFLLPAEMSELVDEMITAYIPLDQDGSDQTRKKIMAEFMEFHTQTGNWTHIFRDALPATVSRDVLKANTKMISISSVRQHAERTGNVARRLVWFETFAAHSEFYQRVAKPLLSMRTVGSIDVERRVKPLKDTILTKKRNRLSDSKANTVYRARENLKHIMNAKKILGKAITDSLI